MTLWIPAAAAALGAVNSGGLGLKSKGKQAAMLQRVGAYLSSGEIQGLLGRDPTQKEIEKLSGEIASLTKWHANDADIANHFRTWAGKVQPIEAIEAEGGVSFTEAQRDKLMAMGPQALADIRGMASEYLGRDATAKDLYDALSDKGFSSNQNLYAAYFTRRGAREQSIADLQTATGGAVSQEDIERLSGLSDPDFNKEYANLSRNFTPTRQYTEAAGRIVQGVLGREASQDEINNFARGLASGQYNEYQLGNQLKQTLEYQDVASAKAREQIGEQAGTIDQAYLEKAAASIPGQFAGMGRYNTSAATAQFANVAKSLALARQEYLLGVGASDMNQNRQREYEQYLNASGIAQGYYDQSRGYADSMKSASLNQRSGYLGSSLSQYNTSSQMALQNQYDTSNLMMQNRMYQDYLSQNKRQSLQNNLFGLLGSGIGAAGSYFGMRR